MAAAAVGGSSLHGAVGELAMGQGLRSTGHRRAADLGHDLTGDQGAGGPARQVT